ncbi:MAG TPA: RsmE family RNA methyltransferase [Candidatus Acidoferrales bacterium]|nr:RsmE family RNA methyltransferase [Candidatus Acidoferrales bacterium]
MAAEAAPRFLWLPQLEAAGAEFEIAGDEAHYLARVVRARPGEHATATDGMGALATLEVLALRATVRVRCVALRRVERGATLELWCGAPEGGRADWLVEKLAELGVAVLQPLDASRGAWERAPARRERWERLALAALRQSRSPFRMEIRAPARLTSLVGNPGAPRRWVAAQDGEPAAGRLVRSAGRSVAAVGPSSGFDGDELNLLRSNDFAPVSIGANRLRTETAALAIASIWGAAAS